MSTELIPHPQYTQTSLSKYFKDNEAEGKEVIDLSLKKLFEPSKGDRAVPLTERDQYLLSQPFFDVKTWQNIDEYSNSEAHGLTLLEQVEYEETEDMLSKAIESCDHEYYNDGILSNMPEFYRRDLSYIDHKLLIASKHMDAYAFKPDLEKYGGKVLRAFVTGSRKDIWYYARANGYEVVNRRINIHKSNRWINVGGYQYPKRLLYRFKRGKDVEAFQIQGNGRKVPVLCVPVYGGTLMIQGRKRPYHSTRSDGVKVAAA